jgi:hypothetical protein
MEDPMKRRLLIAIAAMVAGMAVGPSCAPGGKLDVQIAERAWTSPVWYLP